MMRVPGRDRLLGDVRIVMSAAADIGWTRLRKYFTNRRSQMTIQQSQSHVTKTSLDQIMRNIAQTQWLLSVLDRVGRVQFREWTEEDVCWFKGCTLENWRTTKDAMDSSCAYTQMLAVLPPPTPGSPKPLTPPPASPAASLPAASPPSARDETRVMFNDMEHMLTSWVGYAGERELSAKRSKTARNAMPNILSKYLNFLGTGSACAEDLVKKDNLRRIAASKGKYSLSTSQTLRLCFEAQFMVAWVRGLYREAGLYSEDVRVRFEEHVEHAADLRMYSNQQRSVYKTGKLKEVRLKRVSRERERERER